MSHNILITGASGYLGGTLLARWASAGLPAYRKLFALVRKPEQGETVKQYGAEPLAINLKEESEIRSAIIDNEISIIFFLIDAMTSEAQLPMIKALAEVKKRTGKDVHFLHTSGAKLFSSHAGVPTDKTLRDDDPQLYNIQKSAKPQIPVVQPALDTNNIVIETAEAYGVHSYIFIPCVVYGQGEGFGNPISIQTVAIVKAAKGAGQVFQPDEDGYIWPVCHVVDNARLYLEILRSILLAKEIAHGRNGYYLASSGSIAWNELYRAMAKGLFKRGAITTEDVKAADDTALQKMGEALGSPKELVRLQLGGNCTLEAGNALKLGWSPQFTAQHALEAADEEVELILKSI